MSEEYIFFLCSLCFIIWNRIIRQYLCFSLDKLCKVNNTLLRILQFKQLDFPVVKLFENFNTLPLLKLYKQQILIFVHKFIHHRYKLSSVFNYYFLNKNLIHDHNTIDMIKICILLVYPIPLDSDQSNFRDVNYGTNYLPTANTSNLLTVSSL